MNLDENKLRKNKTVRNVVLNDYFISYRRST